MRGRSAPEPGPKQSRGGAGRSPGRFWWLLVPPLVAVLLTDAWILANRAKTTPVTLEDALEEFRSEAGAAGGGPPPPGAEATDVGAPASASGARATPTQVAPTTPRPGTPAAGSPADPAAGFAPGYQRPAAGVYTYDTDGFETLALGSARHDFPDRSPAILRHGEGCAWQLEHKVIEEHVDTFDFCSAEGAVTWDGWRIERTFLSRTIVFDYRCTGDTAMLLPTRTPGDRSTASCTTTDGASRADAAFTYVADEDLAVGGTRVPAARVHGDIALSGDVEGTVTVELWIERVTGMRLREERVVDNTVPTSLGRADYHEELTVHLRSLSHAT